MSHRPSSTFAAQWLWALDEDTLVEEGSKPGQRTVVSRWGEVALDDVSEDDAAALRRMALGPVSRSHNALRGTSDGRVPLSTRLTGSILHVLSLPNDGSALVSARPDVPQPSFAPRAEVDDFPVCLSRFATLRPGRQGLVLEEPGADYRVTLLHPDARTAVAMLWRPHRAHELAAAVALPATYVTDLVVFLVAAGVLHAEGELLLDDAAPRWTHHELLFHRRSRDPADSARRDEQVSTARATVPVDRPSAGTGAGAYRCVLPPPSGAASDHAPTTRATPDTSSLGQDAGELDLMLLGTLLHRATALTGPDRTPPRSRHALPVAGRQDRQELELYVTADHVTGLPRAIYRYSPALHELVMLGAADIDVAAMIEASCDSAFRAAPPAALISLTVRLDRVRPALDGAAYAVALTWTGQVQELLRSTAADLGLTLLALAGEGHHMNRILGLDWPAEVCIGECLVDAGEP